MKLGHLLIATTTALGALAVLPAAPSEAATARLRSSLAQDRVMSGERFSLNGRLATTFARTVRLQYRSGTRWVTLTSKRTGPRGAFSFTGLRLAGTRTYDVLAPATTHNGHRYRATRTPARTMTRVTQTGTLSVLPRVAQRPADYTALRGAGSAVPMVSAAFVPARPGRSVTLQQLRGNVWTKVATTRETVVGGAEFFGLGGDDSRYRAVAAAYHGAGSSRTASGSRHWTDRTFDEPFDDPARVNGPSSMWLTRARVSSPASRRTCSVGDDSMVRVAGGQVLLRAAVAPGAGPCPWHNPDGSSGTSPYHYLNGHIGTDSTYSFRYGVAAARVKFEKPTGMHGSFWMQVATPNGSTSEVDVGEFFGKNYRANPLGGVGSFVHFGGVKYGSLFPEAGTWLDARSSAGDRWWTGWHVFSVEWTPTSYVFRVDGHETWRSAVGVSSNDEFLALSLLTSDTELKHLPHPDLSDKPFVSVDWVRVWQDPTLTGSRKNRQPLRTP